jgi:2-dehydro-3-deoxy-D-gluconate 5-dehydrogenase
MTDRKGLESLIPTITTSHRVDILVNSAGIVRRKLHVDDTIEAFDEVMQINVAAVVILCQSIGRYWLEESIPGKLINVSSIVGKIGAYNQAFYSASKGAMETLTKSLCLEWAAKGINVNNIAPG